MKLLLWSPLLLLLLWTSMVVTASDDVEDSDDSGVFERLLPEMAVDNAINDEEEEGMKVALPSKKSKNSSKNQPECYPLKDYYDVFISYRRANGDHMAANIKARLANRNYSVFLDVDDLPANCFADNLQRAIKNSNNFLPLLTANSIRREPRGTTDYMHEEIRAAFRHKKTIVPIIDKNFNEQDFFDMNLPEDIRKVKSKNGVKWIHEQQEGTINIIVRLIGAPKK